MSTLKKNRTKLCMTEVRFAILTAFHFQIAGNANDFAGHPIIAIRRLEGSHLAQCDSNFLEEYEPAYQWVYGKWNDRINRICLRGFKIIVESNLGLAIDCRVALVVFPWDVGILEVFFALNEHCALDAVIGEDRENEQWSLNTDQLIYFRHILLEKEHLHDSLFKVEGLPTNIRIRQNNFGSLVTEYIEAIRNVIGAVRIREEYPVDTVTNIQLSSFADCCDLVEDHQINESAFSDVRGELVGIIQADEDWRNLRANYIDEYYSSPFVYHRKSYLIAVAEYNDTLVVCMRYKEPSWLQEIKLWEHMYENLPRVADLYKVEIDRVTSRNDGFQEIANLKNQHMLYDEFSLYLRFLLLRIRAILESAEGGSTDGSHTRIAYLQKQTLSVVDVFESMELLRAEILRAASLNVMLESRFVGRGITKIQQTIEKKLEILGAALDREAVFASERASRALNLLGFILATGFGFELARVFGYFLYLGEYNAQNPWSIRQYGVLNFLFFVIMLLLIVIYFVLVHRMARLPRK